MPSTARNKGAGEESASCEKEDVGKQRKLLATLQQFCMGKPLLGSNDAPGSLASFCVSCNHQFEQGPEAREHRNLPMLALPAVRTLIIRVERAITTETVWCE